MEPAMTKLVVHQLAPDAPDQSDRAMAGRGAAARGLTAVALAAAVALSMFVILSRGVLAQDAQAERGKYLVALGGCNDCHTPGYFFGKPDMARFLGGSEVGFEIPGLGVFHGPNLTPDHDTGLGKWSTEQILAAITKGERPDGRMLAPIMPWHAFAKLTPQDARAMVAYLKTLPPVKNKVPGPFGANETPTSFVMKIVPPSTTTPGGTAPK
jgi:mono/diheme cytochrome c family protein